MSHFKSKLGPTYLPGGKGSSRFYGKKAIPGVLRPPN